jgi:hypothetical protein
MGTPVGASFSVSAPGGVVGGVPCGYTLIYAHSILDRCRQPRSHSLGGGKPGVMLWARSRRPLDLDPPFWFCLDPPIRLDNQRGLPRQMPPDLGQ